MLEAVEQRKQTDLGGSGGDVEPLCPNSEMTSVRV